MVYRETIQAGVIPTIEVFSQVLGCLQFPRDCSLRNKFIENLGSHFDASKFSNVSTLLDGFGEYDIRSFSILEVWQQKRYFFCPYFYAEFSTKLDLSLL